jgi:hypothetical protein
MPHKLECAFGSTRVRNSVEPFVVLFSQEPFNSFAVAIGRGSAASSLNKSLEIRLSAAANRIPAVEQRIAAAHILPAGTPTVSR